WCRRRSTYGPEALGGAREHGQRVVGEDRSARVIVHAVDLLEHRLDVVERAAGLRVECGAATGTLGAEQAAVGPDDADQQLEGGAPVQHGIEPESAQRVRQRWRVESTTEG